MTTKVKAWTFGDTAMPSFPHDFEIVRKAVLQVTDLKNNNNKYYALELHRAEANGATRFRLFTHYGRTDDLEKNPNAGQKECRCTDLAEAQRSTTTPFTARKPPRERATRSCRWPPPKSARTRPAAAAPAWWTTKRWPASSPPPANRHRRSAGSAPPCKAWSATSTTRRRAPLTDAVISPRSRPTASRRRRSASSPSARSRRARRSWYRRLYERFQKKKQDRAAMQELSGEFYTVIPHRIGRTRSAIANAVIDSLALFEQKQELLQLMKDMLQVNGEVGRRPLQRPRRSGIRGSRCRIEPIDKADPKYRELESHVLNSRVKSRDIRVVNLFRVRRDGEWDAFTGSLANQRLLFHGSRIQNWVGILSRGILLPKIVVSLGVNRTDAGWLGNGIYFGDAACTSAFYDAGEKKTRFMAILAGWRRRTDEGLPRPSPTGCPALRRAATAATACAPRRGVAVRRRRVRSLLDGALGWNTWWR